MKVIQSLWTKPLIKTTNQYINDRSDGGWKSRKYHFISLALSCLQLRKFYNNVELVTDKLGYEILIKLLKLPYTKVVVALDDLNNYHSDLWSLGKIYTYSLQQTPFIHIDGDVYIWQKLNHQFSQSSLLAQNEEIKFDYYSSIYDSAVRHLPFIPHVLIKSVNRNGGIIGVNAGVLGGSNIEFLSLYAKEAFDFINKNYSFLNRIDIGLFNNVVEQFLFHALASNFNYKIDYLLKNVNNRYDGICDLTGDANDREYVHALGINKKKNIVNSIIEYRLQVDYPEYYYRIINLLFTSQIELVKNFYNSQPY